MRTKNVFKFRSGALLCFGATTDIAILHEVVDIDAESTCPEQLSESECSAKCATGYGKPMSKRDSEPHYKQERPVRNRLFVFAMCW